MTEEYPQPPADNNGEYRWLPSASYVLLKVAVERLKKCSANADTLGWLFILTCSSHFYLLILILQVCFFIFFRLT